jgi:alanyl-tRNA synthetase
MQRHCGEHILSGIFFRELGGVNKGFHMGIDYMTIDIDLPAISWDAACRIELAANEVIWSDAPVSVRIFKNRAEAERLPLRKAIAIDEDIAVVCVGDEENPADCVACCGTHPATAGQVGLIKLIRLESHKGMTRVYFDAGRRAFLLAVKEHQLITTLAEKYSADESTLLEKMQTQDEKNAGVRQSLQRYRELLIEKEQLALLEATSLPEDEPAGCPQVIVKEYDQLLIEDLNLLMKGITALSPNSFILISIEEKALLIGGAQNTGSQGLDCGGLIKANAPSFNGRGGGSQTNGRAAFQSLGDLDDFVTHIVGLILDEA